MSQTKIQHFVLIIAVVLVVVMILYGLLDHSLDAPPLNVITKIINNCNDTKDNSWDQVINQRIKYLDRQHDKLRQYSHRKFDPMWSHFDADWPCMFGEYGLGVRTGDGYKWGCGIHLIKDPCVIYSLGSMNDFSFEIAIYRVVPHCHIYTFDPFVEKPMIPSRMIHNLHYYKWAIGGKNEIVNGTQYYTIPTIMKRLNHTFIDVLKMDIEGWEWTALLDINEFPSIGQLLMELHISIDSEPEWYGHLHKWINDYRIKRNVTVLTKLDLLRKMILYLESKDLRMFHKEINPLRGHTCTEYSFIQKHWKPDIKYYPTNQSISD